MSKQITGFQIDIGLNTSIKSKQSKEILSSFMDKFMSDVRSKFDCSGYGINFEYKEDVIEQSPMQRIEDEEL